jgi:Sodium/hydrogen exchanger family
LTPRSVARGPKSQGALFFLSFATLVLNAAGAYAADAGKASNEISFLVALLALVLVGRLLGEVMNRIGQPSVMGQLLAGILLGPSAFGLVLPDFQQWLFAASKEQASMLDAISQFGILLLLLLTGMEADLKLVKKIGKTAISISLTGVALPFVCGLALGWLLPESLLPQPERRLLTALFLGTGLAISSIKIVAVVVREMEFSRRNLGQIIVGSAILEDTIGWVIIAITLSLAAVGTIDVRSVAQALIGTALFLLVSFSVGRRFVALTIMGKRQFRKRLPSDYRDPCDHDRHGANDAFHRGSYRAGSLCRWCIDRRVSDPDKVYRRSTSRAHSCVLHASVFWISGTQDGPDNFGPA